jgi:hypothetical protein
MALTGIALNFCTILTDLLRLFMLLAFMFYTPFLSGLYITLHILCNTWCYIATLMNGPALHLFGHSLLDQGKLCSSVPLQENVQLCVVILLCSSRILLQHRSGY